MEIDIFPVPSAKGVHRYIGTSFLGLIIITNGVMDALDDEEYSGSLITLLQAGLDFVRRNSKKAWRKTPDNCVE